MRGCSVTKPLGNDPHFLQRFGRFLGLLGVEFVPLDAEGRDRGTPQMRTYSCFFIELDSRSYFVTAGHNFERSDGPLGLRQAIDTKAIRVRRAFLADYFGPDSKPYCVDSQEVYLPTVLDQDEPFANTFFMNDESLGLDFAFMPLRDFYVRSITQAGVVPLTEAQWQYRGEATTYALVGFPDEEKSPSPEESSAQATVRPCLSRMHRCDLPSQIAEPRLPYFAAKLPDDEPVSPMGFSGSPIFGEYLNAETKTVDYSLVAIDYAWHKAERIVVGCLMTEVVSEFRTRFHPQA
jgi:hypothetical protein